MAEERWPLLANLMACHFNEDFDILYGSLEGALAAAARDGSLAHRQAILKEWRDWNAAEGTAHDIRPFLEDGFAVDLLFETTIDARNFMNRLYDELISGVRAETI
jgi:hypothetical protein